MGELLRSEPMQLVQLFVQVEAAHDTVDELGKLGLVQFRDLNSETSAFQRNFVNEVKKCDEMERKLRFFEDQVLKEKRDILEERNKSVEDLSLVVLEDLVVDPKKLQMDALEAKFDELEKDMTQLNNNQEMLNRNYNELIELKHVLTKDSGFFSEASDFRDDTQDEVESKGLLASADKTPELVVTKSVKLGFVTGVILRDKFNSFERVLWRATRGNLFMKHATIEEKIKDPHSGELVDKNVFIIFYQGERSQAKIKKICESFGANLYPCHDNARERKELLIQVNQRLEDLATVLVRSKKHRRQVLQEIGRNLKSWKEKVTKEKSIYHTMNMFNYDIGRKCLIAEGWCPRTATERIVNAMRQATESSGALVPSILSVIQANEEPPTYFKTNKYISTFQGLVDAYGIAHYREINPGVFTIITFPFLFAVMFGDLGHGFLLLLFSLYLVLNEKALGAQKLNELVQTCYDGRYMLLLMSLFSMYTGLIYNEMFSVALDFGSNWQIPSGNASAPPVPANFALPQYMVRIDPSRTYEFGVDPSWNGAPNSLNFYNSLKMKLSVILGVTQMVMGICLSAFNGIYFGHYVDVFFEFVPQLIFLMCLFGYMCCLMIFKWASPITYWATIGTPSPPFLLNVMIQMFLSPLNVIPENTVYHGQGAVQPVLLILAVVSVPVMLLVKPLYMRHENNQKLKRIPTSDSESHHGHSEGGEDSEEFDFSEVFVKQCIHTIEYVLGAISNTASYLRLWALSLAHSELSVVFWDRIFIFLYEFGASKGAFVQGICAFLGFGAWAGATFGVLLVMESLSAFLHALRLHWVEFQNKFYKGDGRAFIPFSYERLLAGDSD